MQETDFLDQEIENPTENAIVDNSPNISTETFHAPSWEDVKNGKINFNDLSPKMKAKIKSEAYEETPEEKKYLWDDYGYTPPETYHGVDKNGKPVQGFGLDGFEELVKKGRIKPKTKIEQDVENLTNLITQHNKTILSQKEAEIDKRLAQKQQDGLVSREDFEEYEKIRQEKEDVKFQKLQLDRTSVKQETQEVDYAAQYPLDVQVSLKIFAENNKEFVEIMQRSSEMRKAFDEVGAELYERNRNASHEEILAATKRIVENRFNLNKQERPMFRNTIRPEQKTTIDSKPIVQLSYNSLNNRDKRLINSEARAGRARYAGKTLDDITNMVFGDIYKKMLKK